MVNKRTLQKEVPFDQYSRQFQVMTIIDNLRSKDSPFKVLDVGGYKGRTADFLANDNVTVLDLFDVEEPGYIKGSALDMPFEADSFDFVMSFDVLEHIPAEKRKTFVKECSRVAKRGVIISAPHRTLANQRAEHILNDLYVGLQGEPHRWLKEHIEYVIPDFTKVEADIQKQGLHAVAFPSNKLNLWVAMQQPIFLNSKHPMAAEKLLELNEYYNRNFEYDGGDLAAESYRKILCCFSSEADRDRTAEVFGTMNRKIENGAEIELLGKIQEYYAVLTEKMSQSADDYRGLHEHEKNRAADLEANGRKLWERINEQDAQIKRLERLRPKAAFRKVTSIIRKRSK